MDKAKIAEEEFKTHTKYVEDNHNLKIIVNFHKKELDLYNKLVKLSNKNGIELQIIKKAYTVVNNRTIMDLPDHYMLCSKELDLNKEQIKQIIITRESLKE